MKGMREDEREERRKWKFVWGRRAVQTVGENVLILAFFE